MTNDLLITAIRNAGLTRAQIADAAGVDPKTVDRWITGRVPHPKYRAAVVRELGVPEAEIWPDTVRARGRLEEIAGAWARRDDNDLPDWRALLREAEQQVHLIGYSLLSVLEARGGLKALTAKAADGVPVRVAVADPDTEHVLAADLAGRQAGRLTARIRTAHEKLLQAAVPAGVEVRQHRVASSHTILRFDDQLLLTIHLHGTPGFQAPVLHLKRDRDYGIFDQLTRHVEDVWTAATSIRPDTTADVPEPATAPARSGAEDLLDRLERTWRPGG